MKKVKFWIWVGSLFPWVFVFGLASSLLGQDQKKTKTLKEIRVFSKVFKHNGFIPLLFTCDGENISPPLFWEGTPPQTKSFVLICDDPDAPSGTWVHWVLFNIPSSIHQLPEGFLLKNKPSGEILGGTNDFRKLEYGGPCPPKGVHRYFFKIYALDFKLNEKEGTSAQNLMKAMDGHILAKGELMGKYERK